MKSRCGGSCPISQHSLRLEVCYEFEAIPNSVPDNLNLVSKKKNPPKYFNFENKLIYQYIQIRLTKIIFSSIFNNLRLYLLTCLYYLERKYSNKTF